MQHVHLDPDFEQRLSDLEKRTGRTASDLLQEGIEILEHRYLAPVRQKERQVPPTTEQARKARGAARAAVWLDAIETFSQTPPLSNEAISRETIYGSHGCSGQVRTSISRPKTSSSSGT